MAKVVLAIIAVVILFVMFPLVLSSTHEIQTEAQVDPLRAITDNKVTLSKDLWQDDPNSVLTIVGYDAAGALTNENIYADSYAPAPSRQLTLVGATTSTQATVTYEVEGLKQYTGMGAIVGISPLLIFIGIILSILGGLFFAFKGRFGGD